MGAKEKLNVVWLKRDIRTRDHEPFHRAEQSNIDYLTIYIYEPSALSYPDSSMRHQRFIYHSILDVNTRLEKYGRRVDVFYAEATEVFSFLCGTYDVEKVFSYQESGIRQTWIRDKGISEFLKSNNIKWNEYQRDGIARGIKNRKHWDQQWGERIGDVIIDNEFSNSSIPVLEHPFPLKADIRKALIVYPAQFQPPGELNAWRYLKTFCEERGKNYNKHISKPRQSRKSCGRISPYLAWGNISVRQAFQYIRFHPNYEFNKRSFNGILTRLKWHCHFIQKFEVECDYETRFVNRGYELLQFTNDPELIKAWEEGRTGFPMVDACMRCLMETGWINFRMRAMVVSMFCHHFDCDWRLGVYHLARLFLDYEPGIHYPQFQMQASTTGVNTVRMYNPIKQSKDHDPEGIFIKQWVEELRDMPVEFIHEPWLMTALDRAFNGIKTDYPDPVVDLVSAGKVARDKIWGHRKHKAVRSENARIVETHTRNTKRKKRTSKK